MRQCQEETENMIENHVDSDVLCVVYIGEHTTNTFDTVNSKTTYLYSKMADTETSGSLRMQVKALPKVHMRPVMVLSKPVRLQRCQ